MKITHYPILFLFATVLFAGCKHEPVEPEPEPEPPTMGTLRLVIVPKWEGGTFALNTVYTNVTNYRVKVEALKFYLGDARLLTGSDTTLLKDIELFNMANGSATVEWPAEPGTWTGFRAGLGVPQRLNDADPIVYPPGHPLDLANATYWGWATAYRFLLFDGRYDIDANGTASPVAPFSIHTGLNEVYREFDVPLGSGITITAGNTTTLTMNMAVDRYFYSDTDTLDLVTEGQSHGSTETIPQAIELTDNVVKSFSVQ